MLQSCGDLQVFESFTAARELRAAWDELAADNVMLRWSWLSNWWRTYADARSPTRTCLLLTVEHESGSPCSILPLYAARHLSGHALRFLGDGEVCSDYLRFLCDPQHVAATAQAVSTWLNSNDCRVRYGAIDWLEVDGHRADEPCWTALADDLQSHGWTRNSIALCGSWTAVLPGDWTTYYRTLSKSRKRKITKAFRLRDNETVQFAIHSEPDHIAAAWPDFVALHQRRREGLKERGCFASPVFGQFLRAAVLDLASRGQVHLAQLHHRSKAVGCMLLLESSDSIAVYQSGFDPDAGDLEPGHLLNAYTIEWAMQRGFRKYDFLRGDEHYKSGWGSTRCELYRTRFVAPQLTARLKNQMWTAGRWLKSWGKTRSAVPDAQPDEAQVR